MYQEREPAGVFAAAGFSLVAGVVGAVACALMLNGLPLHGQDLMLGIVVGLGVSPLTITVLRGGEFERPALAGLAAGVVACVVAATATGVAAWALVAFWAGLLGACSAVSQKYAVLREIVVLRCDQCGQDLSGVKDRQCPECGRERIVVPRGAAGGGTVRVESGGMNAARVYSLVLLLETKARKAGRDVLAENLRAAMAGGDARGTLSRMRSVLSRNLAAFAEYVDQAELEAAVHYLDGATSPGGRQRE